MPRSILFPLKGLLLAVTAIVILFPFGWMGTAEANIGPYIFWDNGPIVNCPGCGPAGADVSRLQNMSLGMGSYGFGFQYANGYWVADDFTITTPATLGSIILLGYQTGSPTSPSPIEAVYIKIYDDDPRTTGQVIWGDDTTNRLVGTVWSGIYRDSETTPGATNRPVMYIYAEADYSTLPPGTYWLACSAAGSMSSGPWVPPITINGQATTGNAIQFLGADWQPLADGATGDAQGIPFLLGTGTEGACCLASGVCFYSSAATCTAQGGVLWIPDESCVPNPCPTSGTEGPVSEEASLRIQAFPSPSTEGVRISYQLPTASPASLEIFDASGRLVRRIPDGDATAGTHEVLWDGRDSSGDMTPSGIYVIRIETRTGVATGKVTVTR